MDSLLWVGGSTNWVASFLATELFSDLCTFPRHDILPQSCALMLSWWKTDVFLRHGGTFVKCCAIHYNCKTCQLMLCVWEVRADGVIAHQPSTQHSWIGLHSAHWVGYRISEQGVFKKDWEYIIITAQHCGTYWTDIMCPGNNVLCSTVSQLHRMWTMCWSNILCLGDRMCWQAIHPALGNAYTHNDPSSRPE